MEKLRSVIKALIPAGPMDAVGVGVIDFKSKTFDTFEVTHFDDETVVQRPEIFFDLASLTKPLSNSLSYFLEPGAFSVEMLLCLNHRGGLPAWGLLPKIGWKEIICAYAVKDSDTVYSDFSALRVMLELEKRGIDLKKLCSSVWDANTVSWSDLPVGATLVQTGYKASLPNYGKVHDPNAWTLQGFCSHAGLFSTIDGLCRTLLNYQEKTSFLEKVKKDSTAHQHRFSFGWDRVTNPQETLAGKGCGPSTFGHLGFTGTSIWIDPDIKMGHVILTNAVKEHWFDKANLNDMRRAIGELVWKSEL